MYFFCKEIYHVCTYAEIFCAVTVSYKMYRVSIYSPILSAVISQHITRAFEFNLWMVVEVSPFPVQLSIGCF